MKKTIITIILFMAASVSHGQTIEQVRAEIVRQGLPHPDIVLAQARLETGNFTSRKCRVQHNILGIKRGRRYATYKRWQDCVADYKRRISARYQGGDYYAFLRKIGYARDPQYIRKLKQFKK